MLGINVGKRHHRHVIGGGIGNAERKSLGERDALAMLVGRREQTLAEFEPFDQIAPLLFRRLEIAVFRVGKDEIEGQEPRLDVIEFVLPAIAEMGLADRFVNPARTQVINEASPRISLGRGMAQDETVFRRKRAFRLPLLACAKVEELPHREIAGMRCHKVEKTSFDFAYSRKRGGWRVGIRGCSWVID